MYVFAFQIFHTYLSIDSPKIVNIDFRLRSKSTLMIGDSGARDNGDNESIIYLQTPTEDFALGSSVLEEAGGSTPRCHDHDELSAPANNFRRLQICCYKLSFKYTTLWKWTLSQSFGNIRCNK